MRSPASTRTWRGRRRPTPARGFHTPPRDVLDTTAAGTHIGSVALRRVVERLQPPLVLCGHVHEAPRIEGRWARHLGLCINRGRGERPHAVWVDVSAAGAVAHKALGRG